MKKLIMLTAIVFVSAGVAFSQSNQAHIEQANRKDQASIRQDGRANFATVGQGKLEDADPYGGNRFVDLAPGTAKNNEVTIHQVQKRNELAVEQGLAGGVAIRNQVRVLQDGNRNFGQFFQGVDDGSRATGNEGTLKQAGNRNFGQVQQGLSSGRATGNEGTLKQIGNGNSGHVYQGIKGGRATGNEATLKQTGNQNAGFILQGTNDGAAIGNKATFIQNGNRAEANGGFENAILQGVKGGTARNSTARIRQDGNGNDGSILEGFGAGVRAINSHASILQRTGNNQASMDISGIGQNATIVQN